MNRTSFARTAVIAGLLAGVGIGVLGAPSALAAPGLDPVSPVVPIDPGRLTRQPLPPITEVTLPPKTLVPVTSLPTFTRAPLPTTTLVPPTSTTTPTTTTTWEHVPTTTTQHPPRPYPKGAPETGGGEGDGLPPAIVLAALAIGLGGVAGAAAVVRRRRVNTDADVR